MRILIAEDEKTSLLLLKRFLTLMGHDVANAENGAEAWSAFQNEAFPIVITDWLMPEIDGLELCRRIRSLTREVYSYIIVLTGRSSRDDQLSAMRAGADDFLTKPVDHEQLSARLTVAERMLSMHQQLAGKNHELRRAHQETEQLISSISSILISVDSRGWVTRWNATAEACLGISAPQVIGRPFMECGIEWDWPGVLNRMVACLVADHQTRLDDIRYVRPDGKEGFLALTVNPYLDADRKLGLLLLGTDFTERKKLESQLSHAQKMESIGQLAAGIAHEINTPIQYVGDNTRFVQQSFIDMSKLRESYEKLHTAVANGEDARALIEEIVALRREIDIEYVVQEIPRAIKESLDGIERVADIVRSMKDFAHPDTGSKALTDLNKNIETTLKVARNEWKYVAEMETDLDPSLPMVACFPGEINQVILNLIVNAAHAIADVVGDGASGKGRIRVSSHRVDPWVEIRVSDTGTGIPEAIRSRIFDPFFTTKEVGRGTGQGLAIAHTVIVEKHGGTINFETEMGRGTRFIIRLPQERIQEGKDGA